MAAFSIREYALNMRGTDLTRCWPFSEKVKEEVAEALLPPIDVRKFRWWSHELEVLKSNCEETDATTGEVEEIKMEKICPVCGVFVTATVNAMNAHIDSCLAQTSKEIRRKNKAAAGGGGFSFKAKSRTPKKRSIAEIFAVAPPIETMIIINDCEGEKVVGKQIIRDKLKATSLARSLVSAMKTIKAKNTKNKYKANNHHVNAKREEEASILVKKKKKKKRRRRKNKVSVYPSN